MSKELYKNMSVHQSYFRPRYHFCSETLFRVRQ
jgi:hypothetical protein